MMRVSEKAFAMCSVFASLFLISACTSINTLLGENEGATEAQELSVIEREAQQRLLAGQSTRPSLASLQLVPEGRDFEEQKSASAELKDTSNDIPRLSLIEKRNEYEALLPLISDETQRRQVAFRLADIKMLLAEQSLETGDALVDVKDKADETAEAQGLFDEAIQSYIRVLNSHQIVEPGTSEPLSEAQQALNRKQMDAMYQLTRALDLAGEKERSVDYAKRYLDTFSTSRFATSEQHVELYFRIGEYYYTRQSYAEAAQYYAQVLSAASEVQLQNSADFYGISAYMLGWSEFKQEKYDSALDAFDLMLLHALGNDARLSFLSIADMAETTDLSKGELRLVKDSIRVMALTFSYQGSADAVDTFYLNRDNPNYRHLVFEELAQQYLDEDRFNDSASALLRFASAYPMHPRAVEFYVRHIDAFILGGFPDRVLLAKQDFVQTYGLGFGVVTRLDSPVAQAALPYLREYLKELAQTEHSIAQRIDTILQARQVGQKQQADSAALIGQFAGENAQLGREQSSALASASDVDLISLRTEAYEQAIAYYENFISTFSQHSDPDITAEVSQRRYYLGEAYLALNLYHEAIKAFETYAYRDTMNPLAADAAYAAILAYGEIAKQGNLVQNQVVSAQVPSVSDTYQDTRRLVMSEAQLSQAQFVSRFESDSRAPAVALNLMQSLFYQNNYQEAQRWARWLLTQSPQMHQPDQARQRSANLVMAHSEFALGQYASAETYYRQLLNEAAPSEEHMNETQGRDQAALRERLAASLYKQAEIALNEVALGPEQLAQLTNAYALDLSEKEQIQIRQALNVWQTLIQDTPQASFRIAAQYDSASYFALLGEWRSAISTWIDFAQRFPEHPLTQNIDTQLLYAYQQTEDWLAAADILRAQWQSNKQSEAGRQALFQAATFYQRANARDLALGSFRTYAHAYPEPMDMANEARFNMSEFYLETNEDSKRRFWLNKLVQAQLALSSQAPSTVGTERSRYLAAMASMVFARDADNAFKQIKLSLPLNQSLAKKQTALTQAIDAYDQVMSFAVAEFTTQANYYLANVYLQLANDLMDSSRPSDLSALESSQYELLLEEQAYPFEETAIELHQNNALRASTGIYDDYVKQSYDQLSKLLPARFNKQERSSELNVDDF